VYGYVILGILSASILSACCLSCGWHFYTVSCVFSRLPKVFYFVNFLLKLLLLSAWKLACGFCSSSVILFFRMTTGFTFRTHTQLRWIA
jgi:hypothetical protein